MTRDWRSFTDFLRYRITCYKQTAKAAKCAKKTFIDAMQAPISTDFLPKSQEMRTFSRHEACLTGI